MLIRKYDCIVVCNGSIVWKERQQALTRLWILTLSPGRIEEMTRLQISPTKLINTVKQLQEEADMSAYQVVGQIYKVNNMFHAATKAELIKYLYQAAFGPVKATWKKKKAIEKG